MPKPCGFGRGRSVGGRGEHLRRCPSSLTSLTGSTSDWTGEQHCEDPLGYSLTIFGHVQVAKAGLVPVLVALLAQLPSHRRAEVQDQAACLLLEAAACDSGMVQSLSHVTLYTTICPVA